MSKMKPPAGVNGGQRTGQQPGGGLSYAQYTTAPRPTQAPVALAVFKRGRWCTVAKITHLEGSGVPILATVWRGQHGTTAAISLPVTVLDYAQRQGARRFYLRDDHRMRMWWCDLALFERGRLRGDGERYIPLAWLDDARWREWAYAEAVVQLNREPTPTGDTAPAPVQMALFEAAL